MRFPGSAAPLALLATAILLGITISDTPTPAQTRERVYILGFDGMDPDVVDRLIAQGKLPNLAWMKQHGAMRRLETTNPAQSPVAWSSFSTPCAPRAPRSAASPTTRPTWPRSGPRSTRSARRSRT